MNNTLKAIIVYRAGAKGDLLCNFLNGCLNFQQNNRNDINFNHVPFRQLERLHGLLDDSKIEEQISMLLEEVPVAFSNSHWLDRFSLDFILKMSERYKLFYIDNSQYISQTYIDMLFKRMADEVSVREKIALYSKKKVHNLKYKIDLLMSENGYTELSDSKRAEFLRYLLLKEEDYFKLKPTSAHLFTVIPYDELFLPPFNGMKQLLTYCKEKVTLDEWRKAVINSYLPKKVEMFGEEFYPKEYGYIWHYEEENK